MSTSGVTRDEVIRMAQEAGINPKWMPEITHLDIDKLTAVIELGAAAEREAIRAALARITTVPTLTHGTLVKLSDVDEAIRTREVA